jgi:hypothetical protein
MQLIAAGGQPVIPIAAWQSQVGPALRLGNPKEVAPWIAGHTELEQKEHAVARSRCMQVRLVTLMRLLPVLGKRSDFACTYCNSHALVSEHRIVGAFHTMKSWCNPVNSPSFSLSSKKNSSASPLVITAADEHLMICSARSNVEPPNCRACPGPSNSWYPLRRSTAVRR